MNRLIHIFKKIQKVLGYIISMMLLGMVAVIFVQTFARFVVFSSIPWSEELSRYFFVLITVLGSCLPISQHILVRIDVIDMKLSKRGVWILEHFRLLIGLIMQAVYCYAATQMIAIGRFQTSAALKLPMQYMYILIAIGFFFSALAVIVEFLELRQQKEEVKEWN